MPLPYSPPLPLPSPPLTSCRAPQDYDGSHIKGLLVNMFHALWPSLARAPGFLQQFITPIVKVGSIPLLRVSFPRSLRLLLAIRRTRHGESHAARPHEEHHPDGELGSNWLSICSLARRKRIIPLLPACKAGRAGGFIGRCLLWLPQIRSAPTN